MEVAIIVKAFLAEHLLHRLRADFAALGPLPFPRAKVAMVLNGEHLPYGAQGTNLFESFWVHHGVDVNDVGRESAHDIRQGNRGSIPRVESLYLQRFARRSDTAIIEPYREPHVVLAYLVRDHPEQVPVRTAPIGQAIA